MRMRLKRNYKWVFAVSRDEGRSVCKEVISLKKVTSTCERTFNFEIEQLESELLSVSHHLFVFHPLILFK